MLVLDCILDDTTVDESPADGVAEYEAVERGVLKRKCKSKYSNTIPTENYSIQ